MRILFINTLYPPYIAGGAEITLANLINELAKRGYETAVLSTFGEKGLNISKENNTTIYRFKIQNIYWHFSNKKPAPWKRSLWHIIDSYNFLSQSYVQRTIKDFKPDIISCHNLTGISIAVWTEAAKQKIPLIQVLHDYYLTCPKTTMFKNGYNCEKPCSSCNILRLTHPQTSNKLTAVVGISKAVLDKHLQSGLFTNVAIKKIIYNARKLKKQDTKTQKSDKLTFGFIGSLNLVKGIKPLIETFIHILAKSPKPVQLLIGGTGKEKYVKELKQLCSNEHIVFLGQVDPATFFNQIHVTIVPSIWNEPLGMVVVESLGFNVPVIGTKRGGIPEMIQHEKNGLIYDPDEPYALEAAIIRLIKEPVLLSEMQKNAASSITNFLDLDRMTDEYETLYKQIYQTASLPYKSQ